MSENLVHFDSLKKKLPADLYAYALELGVAEPQTMSNRDIIWACASSLAGRGTDMLGLGVLEVTPDGFGFLRAPDSNYLPNGNDIYVPPSLVSRFKLRTGDTVEGRLDHPRPGQRYLSLLEPDLVNGITPDKLAQRVHFDNLTPLYPSVRFNLSHPSKNNPAKLDMSTRVIDIVAPLGKGQRALIVAPPRTGKTMILQNIAHAVAENHPEVVLIVLLIDERPEEVTDMQRSVRGEVISSTFDEPASRHVQVAEMVLKKAKRLTEQKRDVVILLDSITRLARAYNTVIPSSGKVLTGGVDANALQAPKRFFGAARNIEEGGSLTIISTALIETGSRMDEVIFEEFKGTGNAEIVLERKIADKRIFPAIDINKSGTRKEELLIGRSDLAKTWILRRFLQPMNAIEGMEFLIDKLSITKNNDEFFESMNQ